MADPAVNQEVEVAKAEAGKLAEQASVIKIRSDDDLKAANDKLVEIKRVYKDIESRRQAITQPLNRAIKEVNDLFREPAGRLKEAEQAIKAAIVQFHERQLRRAAKRTDKIKGQVEAGELDADKGAEKLDNIKEPTTKVGDTKIKTVTKIRIVNAAALPAEYFMRERVLEALRIEVEEDVRKGHAIPPGAEPHTEQIVAVRA